MRCLFFLIALLMAAPVLAAEHLLVQPSQGMDRPVLLVTPEGAPGPWPLIIGLHGNSFTGPDFRGDLDLEAVALAAGYAMAWPDGVNRRWQYQQPLLRGPATPAMMPDDTAIDDIGFLQALAARLVAEGVADPHRLYLTGFSVGALMAASAGCAAPHTWAAIGVLGAGLTDVQVEPCGRGPPLPAIFVTGEDDRTFPWNGFSNPRGWMLSRPESAALFAMRNGCVLGPEAPGPDGFFVTEAIGCRAGGAMLARLPGYGHAPAPGTGALLVAFFSRFHR